MSRKKPFDSDTDTDFDYEYDHERQRGIGVIKNVTYIQPMPVGGSFFFKIWFPWGVLW